MARRKFKCSKCKRTFSMAAHLGRHLSTIHGKKRKNKIVQKKRAKAKRRVGRPKGAAKKKVGRPKGRRKVGRKRASSQVARVVASMRVYLAGLVVQRRDLDAKVAGVERAIRTLSK